MRTDYDATYYRDTQTIEVSDGHDNVVVEIPCTEERIASAMRDQFGNMAAHIEVEVRDTVEPFGDPPESEHDHGYYPEN